MQPFLPACRSALDLQSAHLPHWSGDFGWVLFRNAIVLALTMGTALSTAGGAADMAGINTMDRAAFVEKFGGIFEKSPWVAEAAWDKKPFASVNEMHVAMVEVVKYAPLPKQLALLQAHPDLAGKEAQSGAMTASSVSEQASAGLNALSKAEMTQISDFNTAYKQKFGFPFIIAVRMHTKEGIFFNFSQRLKNDTQTEYVNDLQNVYAITRLRLDKMLDGT
jgi:2-oxo-4-hydroxy-4-carboxy-5-ureidoimidazoline decarboxylase